MKSFVWLCVSLVTSATATFFLPTHSTRSLLQRLRTRQKHKYLTILILLLTGLGLHVQSTSAGPITGNYWFLGIANDEAAEGLEAFNDTLWKGPRHDERPGLSNFRPWKDTPEDRVRRPQKIEGLKILEELKFFHDNVKDGDTFIFYYGGHGFKIGDHVAIGQVKDEKEKLAFDNQVADIFKSFPQSSTTIAIVHSCFAGGFAESLGRKEIRDKHNLLFMGAVGKDEECTIASGEFVTDLLDSLDTAVATGNGQAHARDWLKQMEKSPWAKEHPNFTTLDLLDDSHNRTIAVVPEPSTFLLLGSGLPGVLMFGRRRFLRRV